jgi:hypothetical protein
MSYEIGSRAPTEILFDPNQAQWLETFNSNLLNDYYSTPESRTWDMPLSQESNDSLDAILTRRLQAEYDVLAGEERNGGNVEGIKLVFAAEASGASRRQYEIADAVGLIDKSRLLDSEDKKVLIELASNLYSMRMSGASQESLNQAVSGQVEADVRRANDLTRQGTSKENLRLALLAFAAGATYRTPELRYAERLSYEVRHRTAENKTS